MTEFSIQTTDCKKSAICRIKVPTVLYQEISAAGQELLIVHESSKFSPRPIFASKGQATTSSRLIFSTFRRLLLLQRGPDLEKKNRAKKIKLIISNLHLSARQHHCKSSSQANKTLIFRFLLLKSKNDFLRKKNFEKIFLKISCGQLT